MAATSGNPSRCWFPASRRACRCGRTRPGRRSPAGGMWSGSRLDVSRQAPPHDSATPAPFRGGGWFHAVCSQARVGLEPPRAVGLSLGADRVDRRVDQRPVGESLRKVARVPAGARFGLPGAEVQRAGGGRQPLAQPLGASHLTDLHRRRRQPSGDATADSAPVPARPRRIVWWGRVGRRIRRAAPCRHRRLSTRPAATLRAIRRSPPASGELRCVLGERPDGDQITRQAPQCR